MRLKSGPTMEVAVRPALWHPAVVEWCGAPQAAHCNFKSRLRQISTCKEPIGELYCCRNPAKAGEAHFLGGRFIHPGASYDISVWWAIFVAAGAIGV